MSIKRRAVFLDRDGVIIKEVDYLNDARRLKLLPGAARAIARLRKAGFKVVVITNQSAVARGLLSLKGLATIHAKLRRELKLRGARLDALYFCPHHPDFGPACKCRKPKTAMIERAKRRFRLDVKRSFFVGDATVDVATARRAGCRAILVRTGKGGRDGLFARRPERTFHNLEAATDFIINS